MRADMGNFEEERLGKTYDYALIRRILPFIKPYAMVFIAAILMLALITLLELAIPYVTKEAIDRFIVPMTAHGENGDEKALIPIHTDEPEQRRIIESHPDLFVTGQDKTMITLTGLAALSDAEKKVLRQKDLSGLAWATLLLLGIVLIHFSLTFVQKLVMEYAGQMIMHDLRMSVFNHIQSLALTFFNKNPVGRLVTRSTNDIQNMQEMFSSVLVFVFKDMFLILGIAGVMFYVAPHLALVSFTVLPFVGLAAYLFARYARGVFRELRILVAQINTRISETIQGMRVVQLFRYETENHRRFAELNHDNYLIGIKQLQIFAVFMPIVELLGSIALALIIVYGGKGVLAQTISLGTLVAFITYMKMFFRPIRDIAEKYNILQNALSSAERIFQVLDNTGKDAGQAAGDKGKSSVMALPRIRHIEFDRVSFGYSVNNWVLHDVSFDLEKGQTLAVVGPTGAGKTTLINLLVRFYEPDSGHVRFNFMDTTSFDIHDLRSRIALVNQDPFLFSGSIRDNILGENQSMTREKFQAILNAAHCASFVDKLPQGADTPLFEGGATLSSGERQLISIARAIARDPELIILDEATSYIDTESEIKIQAALTNLMKKRTSVIIAHRISTARHADHILVLNKGHVAESGTHDELIRLKGLYYKLNVMESQAG